MRLLNESTELLQSFVIQREQQENIDNATITSEELAKLNISLEKLPHKCQQVLHQLAYLKASLEISELDAVTISLVQTRETVEELDDEYEILKLRQKNNELQLKIERNNKFLEQLRKDLEVSRESLKRRDPNPDNIEEHCRQMKMKISSYEENLEKTRSKLSKLSIPEQITPKCLLSLATSHSELCAQADKLRRSADDITLARQARDTLLSLRDEFL